MRLTARGSALAVRCAAITIIRLFTTPTSPALGRDDTGPDLVIAGVHPELGYPTDATFDYIRNATNLETA